MPEAGPLQDNLQDDTPAPITPRKRSMFDDPTVRTMGFIAFGLVILFLVTTLSAVLTGVVSRTGPRSLAEKQVAITSAAISQGSNDPSVRGDYIAALIANNQFARAQREIDSARKSIDDSATADFTLAEARLLSARGKYLEAITTGERGLKQIMKAYDAKLASSAAIASKAKNDGVPENYYDLVLVIAYANVELQKWDGAIKAFDMYIAKYPTASDVLIDRGNAKIGAGDKQGAEKDFRAALKYIPDDKEALDGLSKIGAAR